MKSSIPKNGGNIGGKCTIEIIYDFISVIFLNNNTNYKINS